jgi:hypothetical protein
MISQSEVSIWSDIVDPTEILDHEVQGALTGTFLRCHPVNRGQDIQRSSATAAFIETVIALQGLFGVSRVDDLRPNGQKLLQREGSTSALAGRAVLGLHVESVIEITGLLTGQRLSESRSHRFRPPPREP